MRVDAKGAISMRRLEFSEVVGESQFVVGDLRIPNALIVDLQSTRVADPQLFSCGSPDPQGQRHSYCNGMGILSL